uniref:JAG2 n=1 Tax=Caenorhabditis tropicalis TaxID=1561998 RepID=A0A1I7TV54_9PELO
MSSVDDPEKHFLGNLLEDDPGTSSSTTSPLLTGLNENQTAASNSTQMTNVGPVMCPIPDTPISNAWPEPPPPYSPRMESWGVAANMNTTLLGPTAMPTTNWLSYTDRKDTSANDILNSFNISGNSSPVTPSTPTRAPHLPSSQVHHFHHNLHHHTHTHNVQVQNHYFGTPPPGLECYGTRTVPTTASVYDSLTTPAWNYTGLANINTNSNSLLFSDWKKENMSQTSPQSTTVSESSVSSHSIRRDDHDLHTPHPPLSPSEVVEVAKGKIKISKSYAEHLSKTNAGTSKKGTPIGGEKKQKQELAKKMSSQLPLETVATRIVVKGQPHSAPVVTRMPFSYRDVAARLEQQTLPSNHAVHHPDENHRERKEVSSAGSRSMETGASQTLHNTILPGKTR